MNQISVLVQSEDMFCKDFFCSNTDEEEKKQPNKKENLNASVLSPNSQASQSEYM